MPRGVHRRVVVVDVVRFVFVFIVVAIARWGAGMRGTEQGV